MATAPSADFLLLPLDPLRGFAQVRAEFERLAESDPRLQEAQAMAEERIRALAEADRNETFVPLAWLQLRDRVKSQAGVETIIRALGDGEAVRQALEETLPSVLDPGALDEAIREAGGLSSGNGDQLAQARAELQRWADAQSGPEEIDPIDVLVVVGAIAIIAVTVLVVFVVAKAILG